MSLIEEALRKQREETEQQQVEKKISLAPPPPPPPEVPPPEPVEGPAEPAQRSWRLLIGLSLAGLLAILVIIWLLFFGLKLWQKESVASIIPPVVTSKVTNATAPIKPEPAPVKPEPAPAVKPAVPVVPVATNTPPPTPPVTVPQHVSPPPPAATTSAVTQATVPVANVPPPVKAPVPVLWPRLSVSGVIGSTKKGDSAVIINGQMLIPGDSIEGVKIVGIEKQRVKLSLQDEIRYVSVGSSTE